MSERYVVEVEESNIYHVEIEADSRQAAIDSVRAMIDDGAMPKDIGYWNDGDIDVIHAYPEAARYGPAPGDLT